MKASALAALLLAIAVGAPAAAGAGDTSCTACHADAATGGEEGARIVRDYESDVHAAVGLSCHDCHGGNPAKRLAADRAAAEDPDHPKGAFTGVPDREEIPGFCGRCHSSPEYMKRFRPDARVDQEREYWTSRHGELLREGDGNVATCIDCHGVHGILRVSDPRASVYPTQVAQMCRGCHGDPEKMEGYALADGRPLPVDQYERWMRSVHAKAMFEKEDLSAPTCNDCHGNHGAAPPGLQSVSFVCGQCHGREADLFRASPKREGFEEHNELLADIEDDGGSPCASCHEGEPAEHVEGVVHFTECTTCHGNHAVIRPTMAMLGPLPDTPCEFCHEPPRPGEGFIDEPRQRRNYEEARDGLLATAAEKGLEGDSRFDWLVEQAETLPQHTDGHSTEGEIRRKPEFQRLFDKFRIGPTHFTYTDPRLGTEVRESVTRCTHCHAAEVTDDDGTTTPAASSIFLDEMRRLTANIARTERMLLRARRGGVGVNEASASLDRAVDAQIQLEVLVHGFSTGPESAFAEAAASGMEEVHAASEMGIAALAELEYRRRGLAASLVVIALVLIGLGLKIRELARRREREDGAGDSDG